MKTCLVVLLLSVSLLANLLLWRRVAALEHSTATAAGKPYPLGEMMGYMQRYADKLWFAGAEGNWELAGFYHDEIGETAEDIAAAHVVDDGIEVSRQLQTILPPALTALGQAVLAHDAPLFRTRYENLVAACNTCHQQTKHAFIHILVPSGPPTHWNQQFAPQ